MGEKVKVFVEGWVEYEVLDEETLMREAHRGVYLAEGAAVSAEVLDSVQAAVGFQYMFRAVTRPRLPGTRITDSAMELGHDPGRGKG